MTQGSQGHGSQSLVHQSFSERVRKPSKKALWGLYAVYACVGIVNGFFASNIGGQLICMNRFGPVGADGGVTNIQCQTAGNMYQLGWNLKLIIALLIDNFKLFGTRKRYWIIGGWCSALVMYVVATIMVPSFLRAADDHEARTAFSNYVFMMMPVCLCYAFADVAADSMTVEYSRFEPEDERGTVISTGYQVRFFGAMSMGVLKIFTMSGEQFVGQHDKPPLSFGLGLVAVHWVIFAMALPCVVLMWLWVEDPPVIEERERGCAGVVGAAKAVWNCSKSYAVYSLMLYAFGANCLAALINPANNLIQDIASPNGIETGCGTILGYLVIVVGLWLYKRYFLGKNMRILSMWCYASCAIFQLSELVIVYAGHFNASGWFFILQQDLPQITQSIAFAVLQIAIVEIAPHGLEASVFELLVSFSNISQTLGTTLQDELTRMFHLQDVGAINVTDARHNNPSQYREWQQAMMASILLTVGIACVASIFSAIFLPKNARQCHEWRDRKGWQTTSVGVLCMAALGVAIVQMFFGLITGILGSEKHKWVSKVCLGSLALYQLLGLGERLFGRKSSV